MPGPSDRGRSFRPLAEHMGAAYLRYSFTRGTVPEVDFLVDRLGLSPGHTVLDVGCGPGRHVGELARRGLSVVGLDISPAFLRVAAQRWPDGSFVIGDARALPFGASFDAVISLCQGGFGLLRAPAAAAVDDEGAALAGMAAVLRPGGRLAVSAFSAYFQVRYLEAGDTFDAATGVNHEVATVRDEAGVEADHDLWTTCFTPRELRLLADRAGLSVEGLWSVAPGDYGPHDPELGRPELLLVGRRS